MAFNMSTFKNNDAFFKTDFSNGVIHCKQDHFSIHDSCVLQADVELIGWLPQSPDVDLIENIWTEVKNIIQETLNVLPLKNGMLWMKLLCLSSMFVP